VPVHGLLVEGVDLGRFGGSAGGDDVLGDGFDGCQVAPGEEDLGPLGREGACDSAADPASGSVDTRVIIAPFFEKRCLDDHPYITRSARLRVEGGLACGYLQ
jgi:hypothetical protein